MNKSYIIPSKENYFGDKDVTFKIVKLDSGCTTLLMPINQSNSLEKLRRVFPPHKCVYEWTLSIGHGVGSKNFSLVITSIDDSHNFPTGIATNLVTDPICSLPFLRFFLCESDLVELIAMKIPTVEDSHAHSEALLALEAGTVHKKRRDYVLLGQSVLNLFHTIGNDRCTLYINHKEAELQSFGSWAQVDALSRKAVRLATKETGGTSLHDIEDTLDVPGAELIDHTVWSDEIPGHSDFEDIISSPPVEWSDEVEFSSKGASQTYTLTLISGSIVYPKQIEHEIRAALLAVSNSMVVGNQREFLIMLVSLKVEMDGEGKPTDALAADALFAAKQIGSSATTYSAAKADPLFKEYIDKGVKTVNSKTTSNEQIVQKWVWLPVDFSEKAGDLTPTLKLKRSVVEDKYRALIESLYKV